MPQVTRRSIRSRLVNALATFCVFAGGSVAGATGYWNVPLASAIIKNINLLPYLCVK
jgi:hypothetical protein